MSPEGPYEPPENAVRLLNPRKLELVLNRRGSTVWKVTTDHGPYAVKVGYPSKVHGWTALAPAREGAVLQELGSPEANYGVWDHGTWNCQPWHEGTDLHTLWGPYRTREGMAQPPIVAALACARALAALHDKGFAHGDVQPAHFIVQPEPVGAVLIDLALAHGAEIPRRFDFPYQGCLVHYEAPETSRSVLENGEAVPTQEADVYGLGATLFMSATGWRHVEYPDDASRAEQRRAVVDRTHRPVNVAGMLGWLINDMLRPSPGDRPTAQDVCKTLETEAA